MPTPNHAPLQFGAISGIFARLLLALHAFMPSSFFIHGAKVFFTILAMVEEFWFLHYAKKGLGYFKTIRMIRSNILCPKTVEPIYEFWVEHPEHEAFAGLQEQIM